MLLSKDLFEIEKNFWTGDAAYYRRHLADDCMVVFTEMAGLKSKEEIASMIKDGMRWRNLDIKEKGLVELCRRRRHPELPSQCHAGDRRAVRGAGQQCLCEAEWRMENGVSSSDAAHAALIEGC